MGESELPQWISWIGGVAGIIIATVIVRLGWNSRAESPTESSRIMGAIVDSASVREHTLAMESHAEVLKVGFGYVETLNNEMRVLSDEVRRLGNSLRDRD